MTYPLTWPPTVGQVQTVVENTTSGDSTVADAARAELQYMVETTLGQPLELAFPSQWADVKSTGTPEIIETAVETTTDPVLVTLTLIREGHAVTVPGTPDISPIIPGPKHIAVRTNLDNVDHRGDGTPTGWFESTSATNFRQIDQWGWMDITLDPVRIQRVTAAEFTAMGGARAMGRLPEGQEVDGATSFSSLTPATTNWYIVVGGTTQIAWTKITRTIPSGYDVWLSANHDPLFSKYHAALVDKQRVVSTMDTPVAFPPEHNPYPTTTWILRYFAGGRFSVAGAGSYSEAWDNVIPSISTNVGTLISGDEDGFTARWSDSEPGFKLYIPVGAAATNRRIGYALVFQDTYPYYHDHWVHSSSTPANTPAAFECGADEIHPDRPDFNSHGTILESGYVQWEPVVSGSTAYFAVVGEAKTGDGRPPDVTPSPPLIKPKPVSGGCKASIDGPSSCNFNVPIEPDPDSPDFPMPGDFVEPEMPNIPMPEMPVIEAEFPLIPPIDCMLPDFGNLTDCPPGPGSGNMPGGRDRKGRRGGHVGGIKTGGPTSGIRDINFGQTFPDGTIDPDTEEPIIPPTRDFPEGSSVMTAITIILLDLGLSPLNIVFEIGPEWDKTFGPKTFPETTRMFDAAQWLASLIMCKIIDEGDGNVYIGPPMHRPGQNTWTFNSQFPNVDGDPPILGLGYGASMGEAYYAVKVWGAHLSTPVFALVDTPFSSDPSNILQIEVGPDYSLAEAQDLAAFRAGLIRRDAVMVQVEVPYSQQMFMRDKLVLKFPERGLQWDYIIFAKQSEISAEKQVNILTGVLPATLEELENFPDVMGEGMDAVEMGFA